MRNWLVTVLLATALGCLPPATVPEDGQTVVTPRALPRSAEPVRDERADALAKASRMVHAAAATATLESACQPGRAGLLAAQEAALRHEPTRAARCATVALTGMLSPQERGTATLVAGYAALEAGDFAAAAERLGRAARVVKEADPLFAHLVTWAARASLEAGDCTAAQTLAKRVTAVGSRFPIVHEATFVLARAALACADKPATVAAAATAIGALLSTYPEYPHEDELRLEVGRSLAGGGNPRDAVRWLDALDWQRPFAPAAEAARSLLAAPALAGIERPTRSAEQRLERGSKLRKMRRWESAEAWLGQLEAETTKAGNEASYLSRVRLQRALNSYEAGRFDEAEARYRALREPPAPGLDMADVLIGHARSLSRLGREDEAVATFTLAHEDSGPLERERELATFTQDLGRYEEALAHRIAAGRSLAVDTFENAFDLYLAGQFEPARLKWQIVANNASGAAKARALYWMARAWDQLGEREQAGAAFEQARATSSSSYYGILAQSRLLEHGEQLPLALSEPGKGEQARVQWQGPWVDAPSSFEAALGSPGDPWTRGPATAAVPFAEGLAAMTAFSERYGALFPAAATATALYRLGAVEPARVAVRDVASEMLLLDRAFGAGKRSTTRKPIRLGTRRWEHWIDNRGSNERGFWGITLRDLRFPVPAARDDLQDFVARHEEIRNNKTSIVRAMAPVLRAADDYAMLRHFISRGHFGGTDIVSSRDRTPMAYGRELDRCARDRNINPFFVWSIMTIESDLNADSVSVADAYGLLQVIPKTGELMADRFGKGTFGIYDLLTPRDAVTYGCHYLASLVDKFKGQELIAAAAYNAGPHQLARWMQWRGDRLALDEFIETIPYGATRLYPQKMLATMAKYRSLYGPKTPLYISNKMDVTLGNDIYF